MSLKHFSFLLLLVSFCNAKAQVLTLPEAIATGVRNYGLLKAKEAYARSSAAQAQATRNEQLPNIVLSAQQDYGTVNGQNGPLYGFGGYGVASSGLPLPAQNWNASFGALYLANINWEFFSFGKAVKRTQTAIAAAERDNRDWEQELFRHKIKITAAYLNVLAAQKLVNSYEKNLARADTFAQAIRARALNGLIAGVDSSQANAEVSSARIALTKAKDFEQEQSSQLALLISQPLQHFVLDSMFFSKVPAMAEKESVSAAHPVLQWYQSRISVSDKQTEYYRSLYYPSFSLVSIFQTRASGFGSGYAVNQNDYTTDYWNGISPSRSNYLVGVGLTWNIVQPFRAAQQVKAQKLISSGLKDEYMQADSQVQVQLQLAVSKMKFALDNYHEVSTQIKAASDAYVQKSVLYRNGLTNLVDLTQAMYALVRAETDRDIAYSNVWQALLLNAAATGDFSLFENQL